MRKVDEILRIEPPLKRGGKLDDAAYHRDPAKRRSRPEILPVWVCRATVTNDTHAPAHVESCACSWGSHSPQDLGANGQHMGG